MRLSRAAWLVGVGLYVACLGNLHGESISYTPGIRVVSADWDQEGDWGTTTGSGTLVGPMLAVDLESEWWISALILAGTVDFDSVADSGRNDFLAGEVFLGRPLAWLDVGFGLRYWQDDQPENPAPENSWKHYGPALYLGAAEQIGSSPVGWYSSGSLMFVDVGDGDGQHYRVEAGLWATLRDITLLAGYRFMSAYALDGMDKLDIHGPTIGLTYTFSQ